jgi:hypothetical protein
MATSPIAAAAGGGGANNAPAVRVITVSPAGGGPLGMPSAPGKELSTGDRRVVYECNFSVDSAVAAEFLSYLRAHVEEICRLEGGALFDRATLCIAENEGDPNEEEPIAGVSAAVAEEGGAAAAAAAAGGAEGGSAAAAAGAQASAAAAGADGEKAPSPPPPPPPPPPHNKVYVCARYRARSRFSLQKYFDRAGERLRRDMHDKWGGRFSVQRRILAVHHIVEN